MIHLDNQIQRMEYLVAYFGAILKVFAENNYQNEQDINEMLDNWNMYNEILKSLKKLKEL